ncbi:PREDICTED: radial spoke head protein 3 homolog isoform X1 [Cyprinodon variegatus]|uniref:radial spoke head protein 3 homolog isoform X1 n=1 Tax=Cyprinodon variegatus TaxID=28743 RepID=UPI0007425269|nr:PREDICTED: radial spoke head protein 3 homolog isoform X1 [Cyprinodon variegatus]
MALPSYNHRDPNGMYTFSSRPRPVEVRSKYRPREPSQEQTQREYGNIKYDRRVVRGNTVNQSLIPRTDQSDPATNERQQAFRRRAIARRQERDYLRTKTPEALLSRQHVDVQTDLYLEELSNVISATDIECQTDKFMDKPATPLFIPAKTGVDAETQIEEGELFDFDLEVQPVLEVLVGKTIEQSLLEAMEEEELACLRNQQRIFQELRNNELAEMQRLQEQERRRQEEKERRIAQQKEVLKKEQETVEKIAAQAFSQQYLAGLLPSVFTSLRNQGYFYDPVEKDVEVNFLPWLMSEVNNQLKKRDTARQILDNMIYKLTLERMDEFKQLEPQQDSSDP